MIYGLYLPREVLAKVYYRNAERILGLKAAAGDAAPAAPRVLKVPAREDFRERWKEEVFEAFLWPDERQRAYFEYEVSPLNAELAIQVANQDGKPLRWRPWHDDGARKTRKATTARGGERKAGSAVEGW